MWPPFSWALPAPAPTACPAGPETVLPRGHPRRTTSHGAISDHPSAGRQKARGAPATPAHLWGCPPPGRPLAGPLVRPCTHPASIPLPLLNPSERGCQRASSPEPPGFIDLAVLTCRRKRGKDQQARDSGRFGSFSDDGICRLLVGAQQTCQVPIAEFSHSIHPES